MLKNIIFYAEICAFSEDLEGHELPPTKRGKNEGKVYGLAAQGFNVAGDPSTCLPGYITGNLVLPPKAIKAKGELPPNSCCPSSTILLISWKSSKVNTRAERNPMSMNDKKSE